MSNGSGMAVLCSSVSKFRIVHKDVESAKRVPAANVVVYFLFCKSLQNFVQLIEAL